MKSLGQLDTTHAMYQPDKRAQSAQPKANGSQREREAWMRQRQESGVSEHQRRPRGIELTLASICRQYGVTRVQLLGPSRLHTIAQARGQACRELRKLGLSFSEIGHALNLHHSTVIHHCQHRDVSPSARKTMTHFHISMTLTCPSDWDEAKCRNYVSRLATSQDERNSITVSAVPDAAQKEQENQ